MIVDFHTHIGLSRNDGAEQTVQNTLRGMKQFQVTHSFIFPIDEKSPGPSYAKVNRRIAHLTQHHKNLIGCARLNPNEPKASFNEIEYAAQADFRAVKLHPRSDHFSARLAEPLFSAVDKNRLSVILHTGHEPRCHPNQWLHIFKAYPKTFFILAHSGKDVYREAIEIAKQLPNVYLDTSTLSYYRTGVILKKAGARKVVFASDIPYSHVGLEIAKFKFLLPSEKQKFVFGENAKRILGM